MSITNKGKSWEARNSFWIIGAFIPMFYWIPFFWIATRAKQRKWLIFGFIYLITGFVFPIIGGEVSVIEYKTINNILMYSFIISWIAAIIHSFFLRKEYLIRREMVLAEQGTLDASYRQKILNQYEQKDNSQQDNPIFVPMQNINNKAPQTREPISTQKFNLNNCSEQDFQGLPGVGIVLAKKAIEIRSQIGGFASVQDFIQRLELMPHFAVQIEELAVVYPMQMEKSTDENGGRVIDI